VQLVAVFCQRHCPCTCVHAGRAPTPCASGHG
jgi:hypothetical protein